MGSAITAIGTAVPNHKRNQIENAEIASAGLHLSPVEKRVYKSIFKASGIQNRHSVLSDFCKMPGEFEFFPNDPLADFPPTSARMKVYKDHALPLALQAVNACLNRVPLFDKKSITHIITISCTGMYAPGLDIELVQSLQLHSTTQRTAINFMGCYGTFNGLKAADAICRADPKAVVLLVSVELCTIHFQKTRTLETIVSNAIFSDGAAAALIQAVPQDKPHLALSAFHCDLIPQTSDAMAWQIGDSGFDIVLSSYVPDIIRSGISLFLQQLLAKNQFAAVDHYAIHPGGLKILQACEEALGITKEDNKYAYQTLNDYGNMSSATILFVLRALWDDLSKSENQSILSCAFGPGLTMESMLLNAVGFSH